ncbi:MAG TPA: hypothetical protein VFS62_01965 [Chloroflexota bacterium]|nr:hypothetical protein [Chloroflexota bacterium]
MPPFKSPSYPVELYTPGAVDPNRFLVTFTSRKGETAIVAVGELSFTAGARSCTCMDFTIGGHVCLHMRARERAFSKFAREHRLRVPDVVRPLWADDVRG